MNDFDDLYIIKKYQVFSNGDKQLYEDVNYNDEKSVIKKIINM